MPVNFYHCKYCHQKKSTETALNRHIAHSRACFKAWQDDLLKLSSTNLGIDSSGSINRRYATMDQLIAHDNIGTNSEVEESIPEMIPDHTFEDRSFSRSEERDVQDVHDAHSQSRYRRRYTGQAVEILGKGKTNFEAWQEAQTIHNDNEWAPFHDEKEWNLAQWLIKNVGQKSIDEFLKLPIVSIYRFTHSDHMSTLTKLLPDSRACTTVVP
jgi:hypothetical protein